MSLIVAARFTAFADAERAARALFECGFNEEDVSIFYVNPPGMHHAYRAGGDQYADRNAQQGHKGLLMGAGLGAAIGIVVGAAVVAILHLSALVAAVAGGVGAYVGSLIGALNGMRATPQTTVPGLPMDTRPSGVLLAVHVELATEASATQVLKAQSGADVERASGRWQDGKWTDFDPVVPPVLSG